MSEAEERKARVEEAVDKLYDLIVSLPDWLLEDVREGAIATINGVFVLGMVDDEMKRRGLR